MNNINLLPKSKRVQKKNINSQLYLRRAAIFSVGTVVFLSLLLFALNYDTVTPGLKKQQEDVLSQLTRLHSKTAKVLLVKDRVTSIESILVKRNSYDSLMGQLSAMVPSDVSIDDLEIKEATVALVLSSGSLESLGNFLDTATDLTNKKELFKGITVDSLVANSTLGKFTLTIKAQLL